MGLFPADITHVLTHVTSLCQYRYCSSDPRKDLIEEIAKKTENSKLSCVDTVATSFFVFSKEN